MILMMACSCSLIPTKQIEVTAKPLERTIVQPVMPREIDLKEVRWLTITPENFEEQFKVIEDQEGELVFLAMTVPDYEVMAYNMQEIKRYITELKDVVVYYRKVTTNQEQAKLKEWLVGDITLRSYGTDKYGRVLGDVFCEHGNVADLLKKENLAVDYDGGKKTKKWGE